MAGVTTREITADNRARLVELTCGYAGSAYVLRDEPTIIGRAFDADISIDNGSISRAHARISRNDSGQWVLEDLGSRNGTFVNNIPATRFVLTFGDMIQLGKGALLVFTRHDSFEEQLLEAQKLESIGRLAGGVAHDFNNMLSVIIANAQYVMGMLDGDESMSDEVRASLQDQLDAAKHATQLTRQLLRFARLGEGEHVTIAVADLVDSVVSLCERSFGANIAIERDLDNARLAVNGDNSQLSSALMNLLVNAADAIGDNKGTIKISARGLTHGASTALQMPVLSFGRYVEISVADDGAGMTEATRSHVFEPFFTTKNDHGTGLGLSSAYGVARRHGGDILVESEPGKGSTFRLYLPLHVGDRAARHTKPTPVSGDWEVEGIVMVVDDEERVRTSIGRLLGIAGHTNVVLAESGRRAVEMFEGLHERISLVLLDMKMPGLDGAATFEKLSEIDPDVSVLLISGNPDDAPGELRRGVRQVLPKPFTLSQLRTAIAACSRS